MTEVTHETTDIAALPPADRALIVLNSTKTEADLNAMVEEAQAITEIKDKAGREQAHRLGMKLKTARTAVEKTGKAARDDANAFAKAVIDEQKRLIAITEAEEKRVLGLRDTYDEQVEAEKRAAEARRVEIKGKIDGIRALPRLLAGAGSEEIMAEWGALEAFTPSEDVFGEQTADCSAALEEAITALAELHARVLAQETAAAELEAERQRVQEAIAAERAALEAERAALAAERAELEALRAAAKAPTIVEDVQALDVEAQPGQAIVLLDDPTGANTEPTFEDAPTAEGIQVAELHEPEPVAADTAPAVSWHIRQAAIHTAAQFSALAGKVEQCGFTAFADNLRAVAISLREGSHDQALSSADREALVAADTLLLDATVACIEALSEDEQIAA